MSFQAKDALVLSRQLECQEINSVCNLVTALSDAPAIIALNNSTLSATTITLMVREDIEKVFSVQVHNRATGAIIAIAAGPSLAVAQRISVTCNGTGLTDVAVCFKYKVKE